MRLLRNLAVLLSAWVLLAAWQLHEYGHERDLICDSLVQQANSVMNALVSGIRSHRWMGPFIREQLPGTLEELVQSDAILAVAVTSQDGSDQRMAAGAVDLLEDDPPEGEQWRESGYRLDRVFRLHGDAMGGRGGGRGHGPLGGPDRESLVPQEVASEYKATLLFDRTTVEAQCRRSAWNRGFIVAVGGLLLVSLGWAWQTQVRLVEARGRAHVLESEARHLRELSQAAAGLAHETRNPLGLIRGWTQRLAEPGSPPFEKQQVDAVLEECDRITARINQFLAFARSGEPQLGSVHVAALIDELLVLLEPDVDAKDLTLDRQQVSPGLTIAADREMFRQALFNMLQNAIQFTPVGGLVALSARPSSNGAWRVEISDNGPGVSDEHVESLFMPYFTTRPEGTGLGLAIVRQIAVAHRWQVGHSPRSGGGATFWISGTDA